MNRAEQLKYDGNRDISKVQYSKSQELQLFDKSKTCEGHLITRFLMKKAFVVVCWKKKEEIYDTKNDNSHW